MKANPNSAIIRTGKTRDGVIAFLHEDGTVSSRLTTFGFTALSTSVAERFFNSISAVHSADIPKAIKVANKGMLPHVADEALLAAESRARLARQRERIENDRRPSSKVTI